MKRRKSTESPFRSLILSKNSGGAVSYTVDRYSIEPAADVSSTIGLLYLVTNENDAFLCRDGAGMHTNRIRV